MYNSEWNTSVYLFVIFLKYVVIIIIIIIIIITIYLISNYWHQTFRYAQNKWMRLENILLRAE